MRYGREIKERKKRGTLERENNVRRRKKKKKKKGGGLKMCIEPRMAEY